MDRLELAASYLSQSSLYLTRQLNFSYLCPASEDEALFAHSISKLNAKGPLRAFGTVSGGTFTRLGRLEIQPAQPTKHYVLGLQLVGRCHLRCGYRIDSVHIAARIELDYRKIREDIVVLVEVLITRCSLVVDSLPSI